MANAAVQRFVSSPWVRYLLVLLCTLAGFFAWQAYKPDAENERATPSTSPAQAIAQSAVDAVAIDAGGSAVQGDGDVPEILSRLFLLATLSNEVPARALISVMDDAGNRASVLPSIGDVITDDVVLSCVEAQAACVAVDGRDWMLQLVARFDGDPPVSDSSGDSGSEAARQQEAITRLLPNTYEHLQADVADTLQDPEYPADDLYVTKTHILVTGDRYDNSLLLPGDQIVSVNYAAINDLVGKGPMGSTLAMPTLRFEVQRGGKTLVFLVERDDLTPGAPGP